jgi:hypothetical protein
MPIRFIADQIEQEVSADPSNPAMLGFAHRAVVLAPAEDALDLGPSRLRHVVAWMTRRAPIDGAAPPRVPPCRRPCLRPR